MQESLTRQEITEKLEEFGIKCQDRMLTYALAGLGIQPVAYENLPSPQKGRRSLYPPETVWLIASAHRGVKGAFQTLGPNVKPKLPEELAAFRELWDQVVTTDDAALLPCRLREDREFASQMLMLTSPDRGMGASDVIRRSHAKPELLDLCSEGREFMVRAFTAYKNVSGRWLIEEPIVVEDYRHMSLELLRYWFADSWVREMARLTAIADQIEGDGA